MKEESKEEDMKELSIAEKAKRFDMVIEKLRNFYRDYDTVSGLIDVKEELANILLEIKENEDELKWLTKFIEEEARCLSMDIRDDEDRIKLKNLQKSLAWLEKQGKIVDYYEDRLDECACKYFNKGYKHALEKQDEQEPIEKVEPKFREGEWITNGDYTWKIVEVKPLDYILQSQDGNIVDDTISHVDEQFHSFTIQDAKDGDVLSYVTDKEDLWIMIYWSLYEPYEGHVHYHALLVNDNFGDKGTCCICIDNLKPATKEQRDTLMKAITDAGYKWDADRKELKKIEQSKLTAFEEAVKDMMDDYRDAIDDNKVTTEEVKERAAYMLSLIPQKPAEWREDDEEICRAIINDIANDKSMCTFDISKGICDEQINWLKSLKNRITWKPSDEQMEALDDFIYAKYPNIEKHGEVVKSLYQDLKKLREE